MTIDTEPAAPCEHAAVLITGATGYIGNRLLRHFEAAGLPVRCLVRRRSRLQTTVPTTEIVEGDCLERASLDRALAGIHTAYYLVHSMAGGSDFARVDRDAAATFGDAARRAGVKRIVYLGGLTDSAPLSAHLRSRAETGEILRASGIPVTEFRASIVVGEGSLSFAIIQALVERLPVMICPRWVDTRTQPVAIADVVAYLAAALDANLAPGIFEIGGPEVVTYGHMMREYARLRGLRRLLLPVPVLTPHWSGLWLALVTPAQARVGRALVEGLRNATIVRSPAAAETFMVEPTPLEAAFVAAIEAGAPARLKRDSRSVVVDVPPELAFRPVRRIGGATGWYFGNSLWTLRGWLDRLVGGVGMNRGRRDPDNCAVGDVIDGWTVDALEPDHRLRLAADLRLPGRGWLEFEVTPEPDGRARITQTATFDPRGVLGRCYWYGILPLHDLMFRGMLGRIARRATEDWSAPRTGSLIYRSVVPAAASDLFRWHERPEALSDLTPFRRWMRIEKRIGDLSNGGQVTFSIGIGPLRVRWVARHYGYIAGMQFCDEQVGGPFSAWRHTHRVEPLGPARSLYEDRIEYRIPGGAFLNRVAGPVVRRLLVRLFATRHRIVRNSLAAPPRFTWTPRGWRQARWRL